MDTTETRTQPKSAQLEEHQQRTGFNRIQNAFQFSCRGFGAAFRHEAAFRQELAIAAVLLPIAFYVSQDKWELIALVASVIFVLIIELLNSAIETVVDRIGLEHHELSGRAKDMGSAAVLLSGVIWVTTWVTIIFV